MSRVPANSSMRDHWLSAGEHAKGVPLDWDEELGVWVKNHDHYWSETKNAWLPFKETA